jgi:hypothetical protein
MRNKINLPGFNAEMALCPATKAYFTFPRGTDGYSEALVQPQFRSRVRRQCGPCVDGTRTCFLWGYECTVVEGSPGSDELGIPGTPGYVRCEPEIFSEQEVSCAR